MKTYTEFMSEAPKSLLKKAKISIPDTKKLVSDGSKLRIPNPHHIVRNILQSKRPNIKTIGRRSAMRAGKRIGNAIAKKIGLQEMKINKLKGRSASIRKNYAPQGVIICSDKKAFLGMDHGKRPVLSDDLVAKLKDISKHGLWYEGDGGDIPYTAHLFGGKANYSGGFDDILLKSIKGHPPEFISALFSNDPPEKMVPHIVGNETILEAMYAAGNQISSLKNAPRPTKETIKKFLMSISNPSRGLNFLEMANEKATRENAENFIKTVAKEMWPSNWKSYPNPAGKVAKKANDNRDKWLASKSGRPNGVYVIGAGHLVAIAKFGGYKIIGGESIK